MWDASADAGKGAQLASGSLDLQWADWQQGAIHRHTIRLLGSGEYKVGPPQQPKVKFYLGGGQWVHGFI
jgi:hypothetical protein